MKILGPASVLGLMWALAAVPAATEVTAPAPQGSRQMVLADVTRDLDRLGIYPRNAAGDGETDDTAAVQAAIDYVAKAGGGSVIVPAGTFRIESIRVVDGVRLVGAGVNETFFRPLETTPYAMIVLNGGGLDGFTVYGTPTEAVSGDNWKVGTSGNGTGSTAKPVHLIHVSQAYNGATITNVRALESRYDCLYVRGSTGLRVTDCVFNRAGRNVVSMVGNDEDFVFTHCQIGPLWGLYHFDIEPAGGRWVRDGVFANCVFEGRDAGRMGTGTWGSFLCFCGHEELKNLNITVAACEFHNIYIRVRGVFPEVKFLYNLFDEQGRTFIKVRTNPVGEFRDAIVRGNRFLTRGKPSRAINYEVAFTGTSFFERNSPEKFNGIVTGEGSAEHGWQEDHPADVYAKSKNKYAKEVTASDGGVKTVNMPMFGHEFRFSDGAILTPSAARGDSTDSPDSGDLAMHLDPMLTLGNATMCDLGKGRLEDFATAPENGYEKTVYGASEDSVYAIRTKQGRFVLFQICELKSETIEFRYRFVTQPKTEPTRKPQP